VRRPGSAGPRLVERDLEERSARVAILAGEITTVTFTNRSPLPEPGWLVVCKVAGDPGMGIAYRSAPPSRTR